MTVSLKPAEVHREWLVVDATNAVPGRLAAVVAARLRGKHKPTYTPNVDCGDAVVVVNADKVRFTGNKEEEKTYYRHTGYPGGIKAVKARSVLEGKHPERVLREAVWGMMSRGPLARQRMRHLYIYSGPKHPHEGQQPRLLDLFDLSPKNLQGPSRGQPMSDRIKQELQEFITKENVPLRDGIAKLESKLDVQAERERTNADEFHDNARRFTAAQETTVQRLEHIETTLATANVRLEKIETALGELHEIRRNTEIMAKSLAKLAEDQLKPK